MGVGHGMHTKLEWQQVLKIVLEDGISKHADHLGPETTCGTFLVLGFDIAGFGPAVSAIQGDSTIYVTVAYGTNQKTRYLPCVSAIFLNSCENCELGKIFNVRWCNK
jgi:hypothetical protein